jgi:AraC family transcriptional regulator
VHDSILSTGMSILAPAGYDSVWEGNAVKSARMRIPTKLVADAADETGVRASANFEIVNVFTVNDPIIENYSQILLGEIDQPSHPAQPLIVETISCALAAHLLRRYNAFDHAPRLRLAGLSSQMIGHIVAYIEDNLHRRISLTELAAIADVSRFHFARLFRSSTGLSPIAYVERSRLSRAQELLKQGQLPLAELALTVGFSDQSEFTRRFRRHFGITPAAFARNHGVKRVRRR